MRKMGLIAFVVILAVLLMLPCFGEENSETSVSLEALETMDAEALEQEVEAEVQRWFDAILQYTPAEWEAVIKEEVVPWVTLAVSSVLAIYIAIAPILAKIKKTSEEFEKTGSRLDDATGEANGAKNEAETARKELKAYQEEQNRKYDELVAAFLQVSNGYGELRSGLSNIESIVRIGFGNTEELVQKGFAREIEKVGMENEGQSKEQGAEEPQG
jgi:uncharacterized membrane protein YhiD involved in acid resistance